MLYSESLRLAFVHIHKTGGISFRTFLQSSLPDMKEMPELLNPHATVAELFSTLCQRGENPYDTRILTVIRNPFAHAVSIYHFWRSDNLPKEEKQLPKIQLTRRLSFKDFLKHFINEDIFARSLLVDKKIPENVYIIKLEKFTEDVNRIINEQLRLGVNINLPHCNSSEHGPFMEYYDEECIAKIRRVNKWCFDQGFYD
jgi:hypothetical protein